MSCTNVPRSSGGSRLGALSTHGRPKAAAYKDKKRQLIAVAIKKMTLYTQRPVQLRRAKEPEGPGSMAQERNVAGGLPRYDTRKSYLRPRCAK